MHPAAPTERPPTPTTSLPWGIPTAPTQGHERKVELSQLLKKNYLLRRDKSMVRLVPDPHPPLPRANCLAFLFPLLHTSVEAAQNQPWVKIRDLSGQPASAATSPFFVPTPPSSPTLPCFQSLAC
jgi:hypothetical protein